MKIKFLSTRRALVETFCGFAGTQYEQNATILEFDFSSLEELNDLENVTKTIHFFNGYLEEENYIGDAIIYEDKYSLTTNVTKYEIVKAFVQIMNGDELVWKSEVFELKFKSSLDVDKTLDEEQKSILQDLINKVGTGSGSGSSGVNGATFTPHVSEAGDLSWSNDKGLENPETVNIKGPKGEQGIQGLPGKDGVNGKDGIDGAPGLQGEPGVDGYTPVKGIDYFTLEDKNELVQQVISKFVNAEEVSY